MHSLYFLHHISMKLKYLMFLIAASLVALVLYLNSKDSETGVVSTTTENGRTITISVINDNIVKVANLAPGEEQPLSEIVKLAESPFTGSIEQDDDKFIITTRGGLSVMLDKATGAVSFSRRGNMLLSDNGSRVLSDSLRCLQLSPETSGSFYGAGERGHSLKLNGDTLVMYNRQNYGYTGDDSRISQMNITMPMLINSDGYGLFIDDYAASEMIVGNPISYSSESPSPLTYYFIDGQGTPAGVSKHYTALTGRQDLVPFWSLGYITSKYGYHSEAEARGVIDTLKTAGYPVDGMVLDLYWYGKETDMGRLEWDKTNWPDHRKMLSDLKNDGVNMIIISQPYINKIGAIDNYNMLEAKGMLTHDVDGNTHDVTTWVGEAGMFDLANPDTRLWLRERYRKLTEEGVTGWWGDLGEPEVHPETIVHANGLTARQYHNLYGNVWSSIIYNLFKEEFPDTRLMILMRGGTAGLQSYSVFPWSTDVSRSWGGLSPQIKVMLNSGLSGLGYMSHDVGGFAIDPANPVDPELYVRWLQLGVFSPVLRTHAQHDAEPYKYPEYAEIILNLVKMRYRWLPYNYTLAYENTTVGYPLVRPLNFHEQSVTEFDAVHDQYLWGRDVLVAPVIEQGATSRKVNLPQGVWVDFNNPKVTYSGIKSVDYEAPLNTLPMFVRAGAFIPQAEYVMGNVGDYDPSNYTIFYYPRGEKNSEYVMFEDDRKSTSSLIDGEYALISFSGSNNDNGTEIKVELTGGYNGMPTRRTLTFRMPAVNKPSSVLVDGQPIAFAPNVCEYDDDASTLTVTVDWNPLSPLSVSLLK